MTRRDLFAAIDAAGISTTGLRGIHLIRHLCMDRTLCQGPHAGKEPTFVLFDDWVRSSRVMARDEALQMLAERYFTSHGPASVRDFANWTGLSLTDARTALHLATPSLASVESSGDELWRLSGDARRGWNGARHLAPLDPRRRGEARRDALRQVVGGSEEDDRCRGSPVRRITRRTGAGGVDELTSVPATPASGACSPRRCAPGTCAPPTG
jgi:hypothetical protein